MCNAWNHSFGCTCGWGGEGSSGGGQVFQVQSAVTHFSTWAKQHYREASRAYVNPNAKCPVCGDPTYFYQSPDGGRVFFDRLGKPWPKHPCTSGGDLEWQTLTVKRTSSAEKDFRSEGGWMPFICMSVHPAPLIGNGVYVMEGLFDHAEIKLFCKEIGLSARAPFLIKRGSKDPSLFAVTTVQFMNGLCEPVEFEATRNPFSLFFGGRRELPPRAPMAQENVLQASQVVDTSPQDGKPKVTLSEKRRFKKREARNEPATMSAMALAFEKAKSKGNGDH